MIKEDIYPLGPEFCHAATILNLSDGRFVVAWFAGLKEGDNSVGIKLSVRNMDGCWQLPVVIAKIKYVAHWNPVLFRLPSKQIALYFKVGKEIPHWQTYVMYSDESLQEWTEPVELVRGDRIGGRGPVKNPPICLKSGRLLAPASLEEGSWRAFMDISDDGGKNWHKSSFIPTEKLSIDDSICGNSLGLIQPTLWESEPGIVHALLRSNNGVIYRSDSLDGGESWCQAYGTALKNNNSGICLAQFSDGSLLLVCNPTSGNWASRNILTCYTSEDNGTTWRRGRDLENTPVAEEKHHVNAIEYSYPTVIALPDKSFSVVYSKRFHANSISFVLAKWNEVM